MHDIENKTKREVLRTSGRSLSKHLKEKGVDVTGVGVTINNNADGLAIYLLLETKKFKHLVPNKWDEYEVVVNISGGINILGDLDED